MGSRLEKIQLLLVQSVAIARQKNANQHLSVLLSNVKKVTYFPKVYLITLM